MSRHHAHTESPHLKDAEQLFRALRIVEAAELASVALARSGVPSVLYKGVAFLDGLYDLGAREMSDADILVPKSDFTRARHVLTDAGFSMFRSKSKRAQQHPAGAMVSPNGAVVDVHCWLAQRGRFRVDDGVFARAVGFDLGRNRVFRMNTVDLLLATAATVAKDEFSGDAKHCADVIAILAKIPTALEETLFRRAETWGLKTALYSVAEWAGRFGGDSRARRLAQALSISRAKKNLLSKVLAFDSRVPFRLPVSRRVRQAAMVPLLSDAVGDVSHGVVGFLATSAYDLAKRGDR